MRITAAGAVLIGQTAQTGYTFAEQLVVGGGTGNNNQGITIQSAQNSQGNLAFNRDNGTTAYGRIMYQHGTNNMQFFVNNDRKMMIDTNGKVGIENATLTGLANNGTDDFAQFAIGNPDYLDDIFDDASSRTGAYIHVHHHSGDPNWGCIMVQKDVPESYPSNNAALHMYGTAAFSNTLEINSGSRAQFNGAFYPSIRNYTYGDHGTGQTENLTFVRSDTTPAENLTYVQASLNSDGDFYAVTVQAFSDVRIKDNIKDLVNPLDKVLQLRGVTFTKNREHDDKEKVHLGMIAQEVEPILPEVVGIPQNPDHMQSINYGAITALLIEGMKEQQTQIEELKSEIEELKNGS